MIWLEYWLLSKHSLDAAKNVIYLCLLGYDYEGSKISVSQNPEKNWFSMQ